MAPPLLSQTCGWITLTIRRPPAVKQAYCWGANLWESCWGVAIASASASCDDISKQVL
ncbi:MAG: hypothetical protein AAF282_01490 [Cyanobacteria bacterium P01_A01_bin.15]